jgi:hypothetical protein
LTKLVTGGRAGFFLERRSVVCVFLLARFERCCCASIRNASATIATDRTSVRLIITVDHRPREINPKLDDPTVCVLVV